jgi:hypothetical protein
MALELVMLCGVGYSVIQNSEWIEQKKQIVSVCTYQEWDLLLIALLLLELELVIAFWCFCFLEVVLLL